MQIWNSLIWNSWQRQAQSQQAFPLQQNYPILPYGYAVQPPPPVLPYQPPVIPTYQSHWNNSGSSVKTVSDVENYMHNRKIGDMPCWKPNSYQQMPLYCENRSDWEFVIRAITHRAELEPIMKEHDIKRESKKNALLLVQCPTQSTQRLTNLSQSRNCKMIFYLHRVQRLKPSLNRSLPLLMITSLHLNHSIHFQ